MKTGSDKILLSYLLDNFSVYGPCLKGGRLLVSEIEKKDQVDWSGEMTENSWKHLFLPAREKLFSFKEGKAEMFKKRYKEIVAFGMNILDLRALSLFDLVFTGDPYYQARREKILVIGYAANWPIDYKKLKAFSHDFQENILEHLAFDIFIAKLGNNKFKFYSGSVKGRKQLEKSGINDFEHVQFSGFIPESGPDRRMVMLKGKIENSANDPLWEELGRICLACGKCSIACPTCFCFDLEDKNEPEKSGRVRKWGNCFYQDFSEVAGGSTELDSVKKKIYFWYVHKFVRIPREYQIPGCVSCGRCVKACPVGIDIFKNIKKLTSKK